MQEGQAQAKYEFTEEVIHMRRGAIDRVNSALLANLGLTKRLRASVFASPGMDARIFATSRRRAGWETSSAIRSSVGTQVAMPVAEFVSGFLKVLTAESYRGLSVPPLSYSRISVILLLSESEEVWRRLCVLAMWKLPEQTRRTGVVF